MHTQTSSDAVAVLRLHREQVSRTNKNDVDFSGVVDLRFLDVLLLDITVAAA
jgi:hypothetical protein